MRRFILFVIFCIIIFSSPCVGAEFYKYKDKNGVIIFTDDLSQVPKNLRTTVKTYQSIIDNGQNKTIKKELNNTYSFNRKSQGIRNSFKVEKQKEWLISEQQELNKKKEELISLRKNINTPAKQKAYNNMVIKLNKRIDIFRRKLIDFNENIEQ